MAPTGSLIPAAIDLTVVIGADWSTTINLYQDAGQTTAFDLTGYTVSLAITDDAGTVIFTLTSGAGLTITTPSNGTIVAALTAAQTGGSSVPGAAKVYGGARYALKLVDGAGTVSYPLSGNMLFRVP